MSTGPGDEPGLAAKTGAEDDLGLAAAEPEPTAEGDPGLGAEGDAGLAAGDPGLAAERDRLARALRDTRLQLAMTQSRLAALEDSATLTLGRTLVRAARRPWSRGVQLPLDLVKLWRERGGLTGPSRPAWPRLRSGRGRRPCSPASRPRRAAAAGIPPRRGRASHRIPR